MAGAAIIAFLSLDKISCEVRMATVTKIHSLQLHLSALRARVNQGLCTQVWPTLILSVQYIFEKQAY